MGKTDIGQSVDALNFGRKYDTRIQRVCRELGIATIRDLCQWPEKDWRKVHDIGRKSIKDIEAVLGRYDLRPGMSDEELDEYARTAQREKEALTAPSASEDTEESKWEQRRYEVAREMFVQHRMQATAAVREADELIGALRNPATRS